MPTKILISLPEKFLEEVNALATEEQRSRSELVREALRAYLDSRKSRKVAEQSAGYAVKRIKAKAKKSFPNIEVVKLRVG